MLTTFQQLQPSNPFELENNIEIKNMTYIPNIPITVVLFIVYIGLYNIAAFTCYGKDDPLGTGIYEAYNTGLCCVQVLLLWW